MKLNKEFFSNKFSFVLDSGGLENLMDGKINHTDIKNTLYLCVKLKKIELVQRKIKFSSTEGRK